jgi:hypothetical protein
VDGWSWLFFYDSVDGWTSWVCSSMILWMDEYHE